MSRVTDVSVLRKCYPDSMDKERIQGKIVLCQHNDTAFTMTEKLLGVKTGGGAGVVFVNDKARLVASKSGSFPMTVIGTNDAAQVLQYINLTRYQRLYSLQNKDLIAITIQNDQFWTQSNFEYCIMQF